MTTDSKDSKLNSVLEIMKSNRIVMPRRPRTTVVDPDENADTVRKVEEYTDYPIETTGGRKLIRRVEKVLMPNGRYRYPVTYIDMTPTFSVAPKNWDKDRVHGYEMEIRL